MPEHVDFYSIPHLYDIVHAPGTAHDVSVLRRVARRYGPSPEGTPVWLEPACGTARLLRQAARFGIRGVGFDSEPAMIRYARRAPRPPTARGVARSGRISLFNARMEDFDRARRLPRIHFAFNMINTIRHLHSDRAMLDHFAAVARVLHSGGVYAVGISLCAYGLEDPTEDIETGRARGVRVARVVQYLPPIGARGEASRTERVISHLTITRRGRPEEHIDSTYTLRGYNLAQWMKLLDASPLRILVVVDSDGRPAKPSEPGYFVFVLGVNE